MNGTRLAPSLAPVDTRADSPEHVLGMADLEGHLEPLIHKSLEMKHAASKEDIPPLLEGKSVVVVFEKNSTRTRVSLDLGIQQLGGCSTILDSQSSQLARGESIEDTAKVLSRYADLIVYRANRHEAVAALAKHATVPVVNALTDREHPCQVLADLTTLVEHAPVNGHAGSSLAGRKLAYVGDGNNMCHSYLTGGAITGMDVAIATPAGFEPDPEIVAEATRFAAKHGGTVALTENPEAAVMGADAVATDTWVSMGDEKDVETRLKAFEGFTVDEALMRKAAPGAVFLHCLPGHWGHEATYEVAHGPASVILDEAENRLWTQMALLGDLVNGA